MFKHTMSVGLFGGILALGLTLSGQAMAKFTAEEAAELDSEAKTTLEKFVSETKGAEEVFANAQGVLVCPKSRKAGAGVGAERGKCVLTSGADERRRDGRKPPRASRRSRRYCISALFSGGL